MQRRHQGNCWALGVAPHQAGRAARWHNPEPHGWRLLPYYHADTAAGVWRYQGQPRDLPVSLETLDFAADPQLGAGRITVTTDLADLCAAAEQELLQEDRAGTRGTLELSAEAERLRWFVLPQEVAAELDG